jgi:hypothetical protein
MVEIVFLRLGTQHVFQVKSLSSIEPFGVVGVDRKAAWRTHLFMNLLGPYTNVRECATLVEGPAIDVVSVMQLIKYLQPIMHVGVSPIRFDNCISQLTRVRINKRFVRGHPIGSHCFQDVQMLGQRIKELGDPTTTLE